MVAEGKPMLAQKKMETLCETLRGSTGGMLWKTNNPVLEIPYDVLPD